MKRSRALLFANSALAVFVVSLAATAPPLPGAGQSREALLPNARGPVAPAPVRFVERPGELEFTGRLIVRPLRMTDRLARGERQPIAQQRDAEARARLAGLVHRYEQRTDEYIINLPAGSNENGFADDLLRTGEYAYVHPDWLCFLVDAPNDPEYGLQWHHQTIDSEMAWMLTQGSSEIVLAFVDTGVLKTHVDLAARLIPGYNSVDRIRELDGGDLTDINGHGTLVIGTAGAIGDNGVGVAGVGWNFQLMPIKTSNIESGNASLSDITHGAMWAVENGARVSSASYTGVQAESVESAGEYIMSIGGLFCYAADNYNQDHSSFDWEHVIVVGATAPGDVKADFSSYGLALDVYAPGVGIRTTNRTGGYSSVNGTSFSTPMVNGVLGMIWSANLDFTNVEVQQLLFNSCLDLGAPGEDDYWGHGRVQLGQAVADAFGTLGPAAPVARNDSAWTLPERPVLIDVLANDFDVNGDPLAIIAFDAVGTGGGEVFVSEGTGLDGRDELLYVPNGLFVGVDTFTYTIADPSEASDTATVSITVHDPATFRAADSPRVAVPGLRAAYYVLPAPEVLPDFSLLTPYLVEIVPRINYPSTGDQFAGSGRADEVGAVWTGFLHAPETDFYTLFTDSDDGSKLWIGEELVVDNDGLHGMQERSGAIALQEGYHRIRVEFFEAYGGAGCIVSIIGGGLSKQPVPAARFFNDPSIRAPLADMAMVFGSVVSGGLSEVLEADDQVLRTRSTFGFTALEPNIMEVRFGAESPVSAPASLHLSLTARLNHTGVAKWRLRDWSTNAFIQVHQHAIDSTMSTTTLTGLDAASHVRAGDGRVELGLRAVVLATFTALGFDTFVDQLDIAVE